eukprot:TRINITY_DN4362_c0_g1_i2.p1 TRINITY_DN4362_c0_g1~~TRINITY_DN4362_c0_g1_i2.p1  ORF type:complete len:355 (+),score=58.83 TRINITY_DN4362_c0_g1_i2:150-1214(+)
MWHRLMLVLTFVFAPTFKGARDETERSSIVDLLEQDVALDGSQPTVNWLLEKAKELNKMGVADALLGAVALGVYNRYDNVTTTVARVRDIKYIHPVGEWRQETWAKTRDRTASILAGKQSLIENDMTLTQNLTQEVEVLAPMRSIGKYIAVPFPFYGKKYVTLEGNGRLKAVALAAEQDPDLRDLKVEVDLYQFNPEALLSIQASILKLWNQYVKEGIAALKVDAKMANEYLSFRVPLVKCNGFPMKATEKSIAALWKGLTARILGKGQAVCPTTSFAGGHPIHNSTGSVKSEEVVEVEYASFGQSLSTLMWQHDFAADKPVKYYKIRGKDEYMVGDSDGAYVHEYCPMCIDIN